jgi:hypothetical protein
MQDVHLYIQMPCHLARQGPDGFSKTDKDSPPPKTTIVATNANKIA